MHNHVRNYYENACDKQAIRNIYETGDNLNAKYEVIGQYRIHKVTEPEPVLQYYMATQLYQGPLHDHHIDDEVRSKIAETFYGVTSEAIAAAGGELTISKQVAAFICSN